MTGNSIPKLQNEEPQLKLLRARTQTYSSAMALMVVQLGLTVLLPVAGAVLAIAQPGCRAYVAAASLATVILDALILDRCQKVLMKRAGKIAEQFDCTVLDIPWDQFTVGDRVDPEDIHAAARGYAARHDDKKMQGWYPEQVGDAPMHFARIICQRTNLRYDSKLRRSYGAIIGITALIIVAGLFVAGLSQNLPMTEWVLTMAPAAPVLAWSAREFYRQRDTADSLEDLMREARKLWDQARAGQCDAAECRRKSREFQNAIYNRRIGSPLVMPFLYKLKRARLEDEMNVGAIAFLQQLSDGPATSSLPNALKD